MDVLLLACRQKSLSKAMKTKEILIYCGPLNKKGLPARGGFESANMRNIELLEPYYDVVELSYTKLTTKLGKGITWVLNFLSIYASLIKCRIKFLNKPIIIHITPLFKGFVYFEVLTIVLARILAMKVVIDVRAGSFINHYRERNSFYRCFVRKLLEMSSTILVEGTIYIEFIKSLVGKQAVYFPNYHISTHDLQSERMLSKNPNLIYFGRLTANKGVPLIVDLALLAPHFSITLIGQVAGDCKEMLSHLPANIRLKAPLGKEELSNEIRLADYFIFPTRHPGEGQSNSLTEAISYGVVPICSDNGFNRDVIKDTGIVMDIAADASDYKMAIEQITELEYERLSAACIRNFKTYYSAEAINVLLTQYKILN